MSDQFDYYDEDTFADDGGYVPVDDDGSYEAGYNAARAGLAEELENARAMLTEAELLRHFNDASSAGYDQAMGEVDEAIQEEDNRDLDVAFTEGIEAVEHGLGRQLTPAELDRVGSVLDDGSPFDSADVVQAARSVGFDGFAGPRGAAVRADYIAARLIQDGVAPDDEGFYTDELDEEEEPSSGGGLSAWARRMESAQEVKPPRPIR